MSITGIKKLRGFTLIEVMAAAAVLALGTTLVYRAFFISLDAYNYYFNYLNVASFADEKLWQAQDDLTRSGSVGATETMDTFINNGRGFHWKLSYGVIEKGQGEDKLFRIDLELSWREGGREANLLRSGYALYKKE